MVYVVQYGTWASFPREFAYAREAADFFLVLDYPNLDQSIYSDLCNPKKRYYMTRLEIVRTDEYENERDFLNYLEQLVDSGGEIVGFACQPVFDWPAENQGETNQGRYFGPISVNNEYHVMVQYSR